MGRNLGIIYVIIVGFLLVLCGKIAYINVAKGNTYSIQVLQQQSFTSRVIPFKRGDIKDRNGNVLATSVMVYNLVIDSKLIMNSEDNKYLDPTVEALTKYFDFNKEDLITSIKERKNSSYWVAKKELKYEEIEEFQDYVAGKLAKTKEEKETVSNVKGVWFEKNYKRMYPYNTLACSVLGYSNLNNEASMGIESSYGEQLNGIAGREYGYMDAENNMETVFTSANFDADVLGSEIPVVVDFFATWCGPCRMMAPVIEELAEEYDGKVKIGKLDVDENSDIAARYGVMSIPTIILFKNGEVFSKSVGLQDKEVLKNAIKEML